MLSNNNYLKLLSSIKKKIHEAQYKATLAAYVEMTKLYWEIGTDINAKRGWGNEFIKNLAKDLKIAFPQATGFSERNLRYMAKFARAFTTSDEIEKVLGKITWYHNQTLLDKCDKLDDYLWYATQTVKHGWSRDVMVHMIESHLYERQALANKTTNYETRLPNPQSELAIQTIKDQYYFNFIPQRDKLTERDIEDKLVADITKVLFELGTGFSFVGRQKLLVVGDEDFYIDLLFFNYNLNCFFVIELKTKPFKPEYAGKLNFYVSAVDGLIKKDFHNPTIGLLLCKGKNNTVVKYTLDGMNAPIGVSAYELGDNIPQEFSTVLPSPEDIKTRIGLLDAPISEKHVKLSKLELRVLDLLSEDESLSAEAISDLINRTSRTVRSVLHSLKNKGAIVRIGSDKAGLWTVVLK